VLVPIGAGCGQGATAASHPLTGSAGQVLRRSVQLTLGAGTAAVTGSSDGRVANARFRAGFSGLIDFAHDRMSITGHGYDTPPASPAAWFATELAGATEYFKWPQQQQATLQAESWFVGPVSGSSCAPSTLPDEFTLSGISYLRFADSARFAAAPAGAQRRVIATIDPVALANRFDPNETEQPDGRLALYMFGGGHTVPDVRVTVDVSPQGYISRISTRVRGVCEGPGSFTYTAQLSGWGSQPPVPAPPPGRIVPSSALGGAFN
jgi:hypothetical protein